MIPEVKHLMIAGQEIELEVSPPSKQAISNFGICWTGKGYIWVDSEIFEGLQKHTLLHETLHMITNLNEIPGMSEMILSTLANALLQFIQDNPVVVSWLQGRPDILPDNPPHVTNEMVSKYLELTRLDGGMSKEEWEELPMGSRYCNVALYLIGQRELNLNE